MEEQKVDRRIRKTKKQLRAALTSLMLEKSVSEITVREIADMADINRGTFYAHYKDVGDLLSQLEENIFSRLDEVSRANDPSLSEGNYHYLTDILTLCAENSDVYKALICRNGDVEFHQRLFDTLKNQYLSEFLRIYYPTDERKRDYFCSFIVSGMLSLTKDWLFGGTKETPEEMARLGGAFIMQGAQVLR